ncbi:arginyl-tRNA--protein transferase 1 [Carica papaya]|uniref:arginyl-tRNA--protein transferase 1 n=1 Tax=Carica papaya TaxID=3649 RepID=UPI000B8CDF76|nr:arginyl-tRNA--protein transferase 1 [Carica papaya]
MDKTCCPAYTIRLKASDFVHSKEQLRVHRRMQRFLDGTLDAKKPEERDNPNSTKGACKCGHRKVSSSTSTKSSSVKNEENKKAEVVINYLSEQIDNAVNTCIGSGEFPSGTQLPKASVKKVVGSKRKLLTKGSEDLLFSSNIAFQIVGAVGRAQSAEKNVQKSRTSGYNAERNGPSPQIIAEKLLGLINQLPETFGLSIRACNGHINFYMAAKDASSDKDVSVIIASEESMTGSESKNCCCRRSSECPQLKNRRLEIHLKRSSFDPEEFSLYKHYQTKVHNDTPDHLTESSYRRFLVDTPLVFVPPSGDGKIPPCGFGSFHQQYLIDGQLVAVGVIDILPKCLSSKYLFWDPDYAFLSLGKYSALQEVGWVKENQVHCRSLQFYYLGYYIHSCSKMRYKAAYRPSELLCPLRYQWISFDIVRPLLDRKKYVVLSDFATTQNGDSSPLSVSETIGQQTCVDHSGQEDFNECFMDDEDDEEMIEPESDSSDDDLGPETSDQTSGIADGDVTNILIGLKGSRFRYKDIQRAFGRTEKSYMESQLRRYRRVVGAALSEKMTYSIG